MVIVQCIDIGYLDEMIVGGLIQHVYSCEFFVIIYQV